MALGWKKIGVTLNLGDYPIDIAAGVLRGQLQDGISIEPIGSVEHIEIPLQNRTHIIRGERPGSHCFVHFSNHVSCEERIVDCLAIEVQANLARRYANSRGEVIAVYSDDITGTHLERPGYKQMMSEAAKGSFDCVVITYMSRLGRDGMFTIAEYELAKLGISIRATEEEFVNTPDGVVMKAMTQMMDIVYIEQIRKFTSTKMKEMVRQGYCVGCLPFGLTTIPTSNAESAPKLIVHDPSDSPNVKLGFELFMEGESLATVRDFLSTASNRKWTTTTTKALLQNRAYLGELRFGDWVNLTAFEPVISGGLFDAVQRAPVVRQRTRAPRNGDYTYLLRGLIHCPHCECPCTNSLAKGGAVRYYECYRDKKKLSKCPVGRVNCETLHNTVLDRIAHLVRHPVAMHEAIRQSKGWEVPSTTLVNERLQIGKALQIARTRESRLLNAIEKDDELTSVLERLRKVEAEIRELTTRLNDLDGAIAVATKLRPTAKDVQDSWSQILGAWGFATDDEKATLIRLVVERVDMNAKDRADLRLTSIVELPGQMFGTTGKYGCGGRI